MNKTINVGELNLLKINRVTENGLYLISQDESEVLLPNAYIKQGMNLNDILEVFIYTDSEDRIVATTLEPKVKVNEFAVLEVVDTAAFGVFLDMGLPKDLFVPKNKQKTPFKVGDRKLVRVVLDEQTNRLIGIEKISKFLKDDTKKFKRNDEVEILIFAKTPLGFKVLVNNSYEGMIFHTEVFENILLGQKKKAYIKTVRADKKLDVSLQKIGINTSNEDEQVILDTLKKYGGSLEITSKSSPDLIMQTFKMSKKRFKSSLNELIQAEKILLAENLIKIKI